MLQICVYADSEALTRRVLMCLRCLIPRGCAKVFMKSCADTAATAHDVHRLLKECDVKSYK